LCRRAERFKTSIQFINLPYRSLYAALDAAKVADYVIFVLSPVTEVDSWGDTLLRALQSQGLPEVVSVVAPYSASSAPFLVDPKSRSGILKSLLSFVQYFVPSQSRVFDLTQNRDVMNAARAVCEGKPSDVKWRDGRWYMVGEHVDWEQSGDGGCGILSVSGIVRGAPMSANRLVHIPNHGDFQILKVCGCCYLRNFARSLTNVQIVSAPLPKQSKSGNAADAMDVEPQLLAEPDTSSADSLVSENDPDDMANEQTWPTAEEMQGNSHAIGAAAGDDFVPDAQLGTTPKAVKKVPKGWSSYQAAWIVDDDDEDDGDDVDGEDEERHKGDADVDDEDMVELKDDDEDPQIPETDVESRKSVQFQDLDMDEEQEQ
jgi:pre-rRNA-processing protein TSR1